MTRKGHPLYVILLLVGLIFCLPALVSTGLKAQAASGPDLTVDSIWLEENSAPGQPVQQVALGDTFLIVASIKNIGTASASGYYVDVYYDSDYGRGGPDTIASGETQVWYVGPFTAVAGTHTTKWVVDPDNQIVESDETNNLKELAFTIGSQTTTTSTTTSTSTSVSTGTTQTTVTTTTSTTTTSSTSTTTTSSTPPVLTVPGDITVEATGPKGAAVNFTVSALDSVDGSLTPTCTPSSGSTFALGSTAVSCSVKDTAGNSASASFKVNVTDTTPPTIMVPADTTVPATSTSGAVAKFTVSSSDLVDGSVAVTCTPASGSTFPLSTTTVSCSAKDKAGNAASASFKVTVSNTVTVTVLNSNGNGLSGAVVQYYSGGWKSFGTTASDGTARMALPPGTYTFQITYAGASQQKSQNVRTNLNVVFQLQQITLTVSYSIAGGGLGYSAPVLSYVLGGVSQTYTLSTTSTQVLADWGSTWTVTVPLVGSSASERWQLSGASSGTVTSATTFKFTYQHQYYLTMLMNPSGTGSIIPSISWWYNAGQRVTISATAKTGYRLLSWTGVGAGSYSGPSGYAIITLNAPITETANFGVIITITSNPTGAGYVMVNGTSVKTPLTFVWVIGSTHTIAASSSVSCGTGCQYVFTAWSDGGSQSDTITVPSSPTTYKATFQKQYLLTTTVNPSGADSVAPTSGWYNATQKITLTATPNTGYAFKSWAGTGSGSYTGTITSPTITMNSAITEICTNTQTSTSVVTTSTTTQTSSTTTSTSSTTTTSTSPTTTTNTTAAGLTTQTETTTNTTLQTPSSTSNSTTFTTTTTNTTSGSTTFTGTDSGTVTTASTLGTLIQMALYRVFAFDPAVLGLAGVDPA